MAVSIHDPMPRLDALAAVPDGRTEVRAAERAVVLDQVAGDAARVHRIQALQVAHDPAHHRLVGLSTRRPSFSRCQAAISSRARRSRALASGRRTALASSSTGSAIRCPTSTMVWARQSRRCRISRSWRRVPASPG